MSIPTTPTGLSSITDPCHFGFSPAASGTANADALQKALDIGGTVIVTAQGTYDIAKTVYIGSNTTLIFGNGVTLRKVMEEYGEFSHVLLNKGALTKTWDEHIVVEGMHICVNKVDNRRWQVFGLHGQMAFFYIKDLHVTNYRCYDIGAAQYGLHICTFEDVIINNCILKGDKDGIHFGRGKRFHVSNCVFETFDDAIALNAHDYDVGNPELGWIEDGVIESCHDLDESGDRPRVGFFSRILAGAWVDWYEGMPVQKSDTVVSNGRLYRVSAYPDGTIYTSKTRPTHEKGEAVLDGITWVMVQEDVTYTAGVRNVIFKNIFLHKPRIPIMFSYDNDKFSRSYYPGAPVPMQEKITFDNIRILFDKRIPLIHVATPIDVFTVINSSIGDNFYHFTTNKAMQDYGKTHIAMLGCIYNKPGELKLLENEIQGKQIELKIANSIVMEDDFHITLSGDTSKLTIQSDLPVKA